jgi:hypothetical protein
LKTSGVRRRYVRPDTAGDWIEFLSLTSPYSHWLRSTFGRVGERVATMEPCRIHRMLYNSAGGCLVGEYDAEEVHDLSRA